MVEIIDKGKEKLDEKVKEAKDLYDEAEKKSAEAKDFVTQHKYYFIGGALILGILIGLIL